MTSTLASMLQGTTGGRRSLLALALPLLALAMLLSACNGDDEGGDGTDGGDDGTPGVTDGTGTDEGDDEDEDDEDDATGTAGAGGASAGANGELDVEMLDIAFSVEQIEAAAGEPLSINFENTGALEHDFTIEEGSFSDVSAEGGEDASGEEYPIHYVLPAGESGSLTFTTDEAGEYAYFCTVAGHREAGMEGTLTVQ